MPNITRVGPAAVPEDAEQVMIPMRDGVRLAADLYLTDPPRPAAVVLVRLPYDKDGAYCFMPQIGRYFLARGFNVVVQDVRGKYRSEGATEFAVHEVDDGNDTNERDLVPVACLDDGLDLAGIGRQYHQARDHPMAGQAVALVGPQIRRVADHSTDAENRLQFATQPRQVTPAVHRASQRLGTRSVTNLPTRRER